MSLQIGFPTGIFTTGSLRTLYSQIGAYVIVFDRRKSHENQS